MILRGFLGQIAFKIAIPVLYATSPWIHRNRGPRGGRMQEVGSSGSCGCSWDSLGSAPFVTGERYYHWHMINEAGALPKGQVTQTPF